MNVIRDAACVAMPRMAYPFRGALLAAAVVCSSAARAQQPRTEAQERFARAMTLFEQRNYEGALAEFQRVHELTRRADLLFNIGRAQQALGRYPEAAAAVEEYLRQTTDLPPQRRAEVQELLASVRRYIAYVRLSATPEAAAVRLDGRPVEAAQRPADIPVSPGRHTVEVTLDGHRPERQEVLLASGDRRELRVALEVEHRDMGTLRVDGAPAAARVLVDGALVRSPVLLREGRYAVRVEAEGRAAWSGPVLVSAGGTRALRVDLARRDQLPAGWFVAAAATGGVFLALGGAFGALTLSTHDEFAGLTRDDPRARELATQGETFRTLTNVSFGVGAAFAAAAVYLAFRTRFGAERPSSATLAGASPAGLTLRF